MKTKAADIARAIFFGLGPGPFRVAARARPMREAPPSTGCNEQVERHERSPRHQNHGSMPLRKMVESESSDREHGNVCG